MQLPDNALELAPEDLAVCVLQHVQQECVRNRSGFFLGNAVGTLDMTDPDRFLAVSEAWAWLQREGLVVPANHPGWYLASRRGRTIKTHDDMQAFVRARLLPRAQMHPGIVAVASALFTTGQYETAVFAAFKEVEIAVRDAAHLGHELVGEQLMRAAFDPKKGPLRQADEPEGERAALGHLFTGAMGRYRNSTGHRRVNLLPEESVEILMLASHLMRIVEERSTGATSRA